MPHPTFGEEDQIHGVPPVLPQTAGEKVKNFWYHYKWPSIFAVFMTVVIVIVSINMCQKETFDVFVVYAGPDDIALSQISQTRLEMEKLIPDYDGNGKAQISFERYYIAYHEDVKDHPDSGTLVATSKQNYDNFRNAMLMGTYRLCLLSTRLFTELDEEDALVSLPDYVNNIPDSKLFGSNKTGVLLSDLAVYRHIPAFSALPGDTVVCLRKDNVVNTSSELLLRHAAVLQLWIDYLPPEDPSAE